MTYKTSLAIAATAIILAAGTMLLTPNGANAQSFEAMDADGDGVVTQEEFESFLAERPRLQNRAQNRSQNRGMTRGMARDGRAGPGGGHGIWGTFGPIGDIDDEARAALAERLVERFDTDGDGMISEAEIIAGLEYMQEMRNDPAARSRMMFERMDTDGDGMISAEEFEAHHTEMRERMQDRADAMRDRGGKQRPHRHGPRHN